MENALIAGRYQLQDLIGAGGEARVYRAHDLTAESDVAQRLAIQPDFTERANDPAPPAFHENWVHLLDRGVDPVHGSYQVFELLEGQSLRQWAMSGPLEANDWGIFVDQSLNAVEALHNAGYVHGDINADNFFATAAGWKLLELPFLRLAPPAGRSAVFGSINTLAPEQIDGAKPDLRSDLYSLGCLYYYAASGVYPHPGATARDVAIHCLRFEPEPLAEKAPLLSAPWPSWVMNFLARNPDERVPNIAAARQLLGVA
jgi:serine/threonine protein kinase